MNRKKVLSKTVVDLNVSRRYSSHTATPGFAQSSPCDEAKDARSLLLYSVPRLRLSANTVLGAENSTHVSRRTTFLSEERSGDVGESCVTVGVDGVRGGGSTASGT